MLFRASERCLLQLGRRYVYAASLSTQTGQKVITLDNMNPQVKKMEYAVRGPLVIRATAIEKELEAVSLSCHSCTRFPEVQGANTLHQVFIFLICHRVEGMFTISFG
ncbi:Alanine aminotransferase 2 [Portunus trituberculatus]|uniref:Alanine aminotransferase 2 n=1 Tax=Portunus trituberculatus TaxID=210409 RepID=A0A5B7JUF5_PORTR|nr:Alanine aminotransferase 2 [Portunus trituberculatus]